MSEALDRVGMPPAYAAATRGFLGDDAVGRMEWTRTETFETTTLPTRLRRQPLMAALCLAGIGWGVVGARSFENAFARGAWAILLPSYFLYQAHRFYDLLHWETTKRTSYSIEGRGREPSLPTFELAASTDAAKAIPDCPYGSWGHCWKRADDQPTQEPESLSPLNLHLPDDCGIPHEFRECAIPTSLLPAVGEKVQLWCSWSEEERVLVNLSLNSVVEVLD